MKAKTGVFKPKPIKKSLPGAIQKKKFSKPTGGVLKNIVKITDAFEDLKAGNHLTGISCSREPKAIKKTASKASKETKKTDINKTASKASKETKKTDIKKTTSKVSKETTKTDIKIPKNNIGSIKKTSKKPVIAPIQKKPKKEIVDGAPKVSLKSKLLESSSTTKVNTNEDDPKLDITKVESLVNGLFTSIKNSSTFPKNELWDEAIPIHLVVTAVKMGVGPKRVIRIALPNSLITDTTDICLIVPDLVRGRNVDHEKTYHHYKDLLAEKGIKNIKTILPARQIRVEFNEFEARRNLCHSHDIFLIDQKISGFMVKKLGKEFYIKRKFPITVKLTKKHLKAEIESKLHKTSFFLDYKGTTKTVQVGHMKQTPRQVAENIIATFDNLAYNFPGGLKNIRCLLVKSPTSESLPVYYSLISRNDIKAPFTKSKLYSKDKEVEGELFGKRVSVKPNGEITVFSGSEDESDYGDDDDVKPMNKKRKQKDIKEESTVVEDNEEQSDQVNEKESVKNNDLESDEAGTESEDGDDVEAEYLMEFEQTKKLQSKKKRKQESKETDETNIVKVERLEDNINGNKSVKAKNKKVNKTAKKKKISK